MDPFDIIPQQLWNKILDKIESAVDKLNFVQCNSTLEAAFQVKIDEWRFIGVLLIVMRKFSNSPIFLFCDGDYGKALKKLIFTSRQISSHCCKTIDHFTEDYWKKFGYAPPFLRWASFGSRSRVANFLNDMKDCPKERSPILSGALYLYCTADPPRENIDNIYRMPNACEIVQLCNICWRNVRRVDLSINVNSIYEVSKDKEGTFIRDVLTQLKDVQNLRCSFHTLLKNPDVIPELDETNLPVDLPSLPKLKKIDISGYNSSSLLFKYAHVDFKCYFPQLTELDMYFLLWKESYNVGGLFPVLQKLNLRSIPIMDTETQQKLIRFSQNIDYPMLQSLVLNTTVATGRDSQEEMQERRDKLESEMKNEALAALGKLRENSKWSCSQFKSFCIEETCFLFSDYASFLTYRF